MAERIWMVRLARASAWAGALLVALGVAGAQEPLVNRVDPATVKLLFEQPPAADFVPGEIIVKMKREMTAAEGVAEIAGVRPTMGLEAAESLTSGGEIIVRLAGAAVVAMSADDVKKETLATVEALRADPDVEYAQPNYYLHIAVTPNDTHYPRQWHYFDHGNGAGRSPGGIGLPTAWAVTTGDPAVVVAVIDTGILPAHPDVAGSPNLVAGFDMISNTFVANDGDGRDADPTDPGDAVAAGECGPGRPARPSSWHGTHVAGTVGVGRTDNGLGVAGVNWNVRVQPVRALGRCGGLTTDINDAIRWAAGLPVPGAPANATPARVINMSLGGAGSCATTPAQQAAIDDAVGAGVTVVVAAGNDAQDASGFHPASCNGVITVAAADYRGRLVTRYSNFGATVEILAPGGDVDRDDNGDGFPDGVLSMVDGGYAFYNGTSMAAPHVAGVAALLLATDPGLTPAQVLARLQASALPRSATECPLPCGAGLLQADLAAAPAGPSVALSPASLRLRPGEAANLDARVLDGGGAPLPGVNVTFQSADPAVATVGAAAVTDAAGNARTTVTGQAAGGTQITARAAGAQGQAAVQVVTTVPAVSLWGLLAAALAMTLLLLLRRRRSFAGGPG